LYIFSAQVFFLKGGNGGYGNAHFKVPENQRPKEWTPGKPGRGGVFIVELRLIADVGFVGLPNAGKSSLLNALTRAKAKVGDYQFTTLEPNLGDMYGFILADIPGLIEGARKLGKARQETESMLLMAGSLGKDELFGLLSAKSSDELYDAIRGTRIGARFLSSGSVRGISRAQIKSAFSNPQEGRLDLLMAALDSYYYEAAASAISPVEKDAKTIIGLLRFETDSKNAITIMRLKKSGADKKTIMASMVRGGSLTKSQLEKIAIAKDAGDAASIAGQYIHKTEIYWIN
jgi:hypothetical protein